MIARADIAVVACGIDRAAITRWGELTDVSYAGIRRTRIAVTALVICLAAIRCVRVATLVIIARGDLAGGWCAIADIDAAIGSRDW